MIILATVLLTNIANAKPDTGLKCEGKFELLSGFKNTGVSSTKRENRDIHVMVTWVGENFMALFVNDKMWFLTDQCFSHERGLSCESEEQDEQSYVSRELSLSSSTGLLKYTIMSSVKVNDDTLIQKADFNGSCSVQKKLF